jgi:hypothetical protein
MFSTTQKSYCKPSCKTAWFFLVTFSYFLKWKNNIVILTSGGFSNFHLLKFKILLITFLTSWSDVDNWFCQMEVKTLNKIYIYPSCNHLWIPTSEQKDIHTMMEWNIKESYLAQNNIYIPTTKTHFMYKMYMVQCDVPCS